MIQGFLVSNQISANDTAVAVPEGSDPEVIKQPQMPQQEEMPFAVVQGKELTVVPKDLYIPPDALEVILEAFEGPLDLLLYLIRRQNLDILDIDVAEITRQYMGYIEHGLNTIRASCRIFSYGGHAC